VFGQIVRRGELRIGGQHLGTGRNGRRTLRSRRSTWACKAKKKGKKLGKLLDRIG
jgi:hypothetical protein